MQALTLSPSLFTILSDLVEERTGLHYTPEDYELFGSKVAARAVESGFESLLDYYYFLRYDDPRGDELDRLVETLVIHETYFFREAEQLRVLCDSVVAPLVATGARPRIWCAAAATGEEPLTLAMLLGDRGLLDRVELVATDISARALVRASERTYGRRSLRALRPEQHGRWLDVVGDQVVVRDELYRAIRWQRLNLLDEAAVTALGSFDAILCRNVLIYFSEDTVRRVATSLAARLNVSGVLLVGASESLLRFGTLLECEERGGTFFYRRAA